MMIHHLPVIIAVRYRNTVITSNYDKIVVSSVSVYDNNAELD